MKIPGRVQQGLSILVIAFAIGLMHSGIFPVLVAPAILLLVIGLFLKFISKEGFADLMFSFDRFSFKPVWVGAAAAVALALFFQFLWNPLMDKILPGEKIDLYAFSFIRDSAYNYAFLLLIALLLGGFFEEILFHGFLYTRLEKIFSGNYALVTNVLLTNIIFGLYHYHLGIKEVLLATLAGLAYHYVLLKFNRNLWYGIFFHAFFDFIGLTQIYLGYN